MTPLRGRGRGVPVLAMMLIVAACATSPMGRDQLLLFPDDEINSMGAAAFDDLRASANTSDDSEINDYVLCVVEEITAAPELSDRQWEVAVFADEQVNAFALPGGKIGVYEGLLGVAENQDQLATVIAHEVGHVIARHSNERISTQFATGTGLDLIGAVAGTETPLKQTLFGLLGVGAQVGVLLPFSRTQETEADLIGLELMAAAGFDPGESIALWRNMSAAGGESPPEFLSTHPSSETRIEALEEHMPDALRAHEAARAAGRRPSCR